MTELAISRDERLALKARAHHLDPVVLLGAAGLSEAALREIDRALGVHGLIKVRTGAGDRDEREAQFSSIADRLGAARIQQIGRLLVFYRPLPPQTDEAGPQRKARGAGRAGAPRTARAGGGRGPAQR
jgi:putative YhbY family RNA-binding protein